MIHRALGKIGRHRYRCLELLAVLIIAAAGSSYSSAASQYRVGLARVDITPSYPIRLNGFGGRRDETDRVTQRIWAKAIAVQQGDAPPFVLVTLDSLGIRLDMVDEVARQLARDHGLPRENFAVAFSHSHTTPKVNGASDTIFSSPIPPTHQRHIDQYTRELTTRLSQVAEAALSDLRPAELAWSTGTVKFARNRRTPGGPVDHQLPVLVVHGPDGALRAILATYACHCVTLSHNQIGGDWAGFAQEAIERALPGTMAMISIGCGSDANPSSGVTEDNLAAAAEQGGEIAREVERLLQLPLRPITGPITARLTHIDIPLQPVPNAQELQRLAEQGGPAGYNATYQLEKLARGEPLQQKLDYPIQSICFGDSLCMVFLAGEVCVDYAIRLRTELDADRIWLHGYANDFCAYIPSERLLQEGGYGGGAEVVYFGLPAKLATGVEQRIVDEVHRQVPSSYQTAADNTPSHGQAPTATQISVTTQIPVTTPTSAMRATPPRDPDEALRTMQLDARFRVELVAAEPLVIDPVAIDFADDGSLWVCEMNDYPRAMDGTTPASGKIVRLVDDDHDGRYDRRIVFWNNVPFPSGITVWRQGVLVCSAPFVYYAEDTDGDGIADRTQPLLEGFAQTNDHARINGFRWGLDNWLYGANGLISGEIQIPPHGKKLDIAGRDFRFVPFTDQLEPLSGLTQYGRVRDDWGKWFGCDNLVLARHYPLAETFVRTHARFPLPPSEHDLAPSGEAHRLYPAGDTVRFELSGGLGDVTSACGIEVYRDTRLGNDLYGDIFTCEPVNQLVHRMKPVPKDITFDGRRAPEEVGREFLASDDQWFRPVQVRTGPDGALWVVDMYRYVIEHPRWIPEEVVRGLSILAGNDRGRIYRIVPQDGPQRSLPKLPLHDVAEMARLIDSPNGTLRDMLQQHLVTEPPPVAQRSRVHDALWEVCRQSPHAAARAQALCVLDGLNMLSKKECFAALEDTHPGVRYQALRLWCERELPSNHDLNLVDRLVNDEDLRVRWQLAYQLHGMDDANARAQRLARLADSDRDSIYLRHAVLSGLDRDTLLTFVDFLPGLQEQPARWKAWIEPVARLCVIDQADEPLRKIAFPASAISADGTPSFETLQLLRKLMEVDGTWVLNHLPDLPRGDQHGDVRSWTEMARQIAGNEEVDASQRADALSLLSRRETEFDIDLELLQSLITPRTPTEVAAAALRAMGRMATTDASDALIEAWTGLTPDLRKEVIGMMVEQRALWDPLSQALTRGDVLPSQLDAQARQELFQHRYEPLREAFKALEGAAQESDRQAVVDRYVAAVTSPGDSQRGREQYRRVCAACHRLSGEGYDVGPDLASLSYRSIPAFAQAVFDPNRAVEERYQVYQAVLEDGRIMSGILKQTTAQSIQLMAAEGKLLDIPRDELEMLASNGLSLMPVGLEKDITTDQFVDLMAFLLERAPKPKSFPGNAPEIVEADATGRLALTARNAEIFGRDIRFEPEQENIGYWHSETDEVAWTIRISEAQAFDVRLAWACTDNSAGNRFVCEGLGAPLNGEVDSTGGYDKYETVSLGKRYLTAGEHRVVIRPAAPLIRTNVMDLKAITLVPSDSP